MLIYLFFFAYCIMTKKTMRRKKQCGGNSDSAWSWTMGNAGNILTQFANTFKTSPGENLSVNQSNNLVPIKRGGKGHKHKKRGGNFVSQAAAPLVLLGLNQLANTKTKKHRRRHRRH